MRLFLAGISNKPSSSISKQFVGPRCAMFGGCFIFGLGAALTYFTLDAGLPAVAFTYGFVSAFGQGIALIPTMVSQSVSQSESSFD